MARRRTNVTTLHASGKSIGVFVLTCIGWFVLAFIAVMIFNPSNQQTVENHVALLVVSLSLVFLVLPRVRSLRVGTYGEYLKMAGLHQPSSRSQVIPATVFLVVCAAGTSLDLHSNGLGGILTYHGFGLQLILVSSLQPAISEEFVLRGVLFGPA